MDRRLFLAALGSTAFSLSTTEAEAGRRQCRRRRRVNACPSPMTHCQWSDKTQITFLVGGKFSSFASTDPCVRASLWFWNIPDRGAFYWEAHDRCWCNVYGAGTNSSDDHFEWEGTFNPTECKVLKAAKTLHRICKELKASQAPNLASVRLIGHSAGANVCNFATHLMAGDFKIEQLILLSPPVYLPDNAKPHPHFPKHYAMAFPCLSNIKSGDFFIFRPSHDKILEPLKPKNICRSYDHDALRKYPDANISAVPGKQIETIVAAQPGNRHWEPCDPEVWSQYNLWKKVGCTE